MKRCQNKSNLSVVQDYLDGNRPFIQVGYSGNKNKYRGEGEKWKDSDGIEWERKNGRNIRLTKTQGDMIREMISQKCACGQVIRWGSNLDQKFFNRTGLCESCLINYETSLRIVGVYNEYEKYKLASYELGKLKEIKEKLTDVINFFKESTGDVEAICNSEGFIERWRGTDKTEIVNGAKKDLKTAIKKISEVTKIVSHLKRTYTTTAKKYKLKIYV